MIPIDNLLSRLDKVRQCGPHKYAACCPAHDDKSPSLSIRQADDGKILLWCFVGCSAEDVLDALGMTFTDLYPDDPCKAAYRAACANGGRKWERRFLPEIDLRREDVTVLRIAEKWIKQGRTLNLEDQARLDLALERLNHEGAA